jgi:hypothetical protein
MKVLDQTINDQIKKAEEAGDWTLCLSLLELKQSRLERRYIGMVRDDKIHRQYLETKIKF